MGKLKAMSGKLILCACELAVGIVLLTEPESFTKLVVTAASILFCILGAFSAVNYFRTDPEEAAMSQQLIHGLVALCLGVLLVYKADWIVNSFMPVTLFYGVAALLTGIVKLQWTVDMLRLRRGMWQTTAVASALSLILAAIVFASPFRVRDTLWTFTAIALIVLGVVDGVSAVLSQMDRSASKEG